MLKKLSNRSLVLIGNTLEFFDLYLYTHLAIIINQKFFPGFPPDHFILKGISLMNLYLFAPMACLAWGMLGDLQGRKKVLLVSSFAMGICTFLIALLPEYAWWDEGYGEISILLFLLLRLFQGVAMAGEPLAAKLYSVEESTDVEKELPRWVAKMTAAEMMAGIGALGSGYITLHYLMPYWSQAWRFPFFLAFLSVLVTIMIRRHLNEAQEYDEAETYLAKTYDQPVNVFKAEQYAMLIKSINFGSRNIWVYVILALTYPLVFVINFLHISPMIVKKFGYAPEAILQYNLAIVCGELFLTLSSVYIATALRLPKKATMIIFQAIAVSMLGLFAYGIIDQEFPLWVYIFCQAMMISFTCWNLVYGSILKTFPVIQRFTILSAGWGIARIINFILITIGLSFLISKYGISSACAAAAGFIILGMIAVCAYVPYEKLQALSASYSIKDAKKKNSQNKYCF